MRLIYYKPRMLNLSQGERISFIRQLRMMTQDELSDYLGITGDCKRRTMTRYERNHRSPKEERIHELSRILQVNEVTIRKYDFIKKEDLIYFLFWLEELYPHFRIEFNSNRFDDEWLQRFMNEWNDKRTEKDSRTIAYREYQDWKRNYELEEEE